MSQKGKKRLQNSDKQREIFYFFFQLFFEVDLLSFLLSKFGEKGRVYFSPWMIGSQDIFLTIFSPAVAVVELAVRHSSGGYPNFFSPSGQCLSATQNRVRSNSASIMEYE